MKIDRLFSIVQILINKKSVTARELAEHFGVSVRTIYRDVEVLSENNVPVYCSQGKGGGISILEGYLIDKTLLSDKEQKQILASLQSMKVTGKMDVENSLIKLSNLFKKNEIDWIKIDFSDWQINDSEDTKFDILKDSIINFDVVKFMYFSNKGKMTKRVVEPIKLVFKKYRWYLYGFCRLRGECRFFKLSRMEELHKANEKFAKREYSEINTNYDVEEGPLIKVKFRINKRMASRVYDEFRHGLIEARGDEFIVESKIPNNNYIYPYLLSYGEDLVILEPKQLREDFKKLVNNILKKY